MPWICKVRRPATALTDSKLWISTKAIQDNSNRYRKVFCRNKVQQVAKSTIKTPISITSRTQDKEAMRKWWSSPMATAYLISNSSKPVKGRSPMDKTCFQNLTKVPKQGQKQHQSQKMLTRNYRSRWELNRPNNLKTNLNIKKIFWNN